MLNTFTRLAALFTLASLSLIGPSDRAQAQAYPIDCAILLCLSGGWPESAPCVRARAEFMRRITPWPVEPPLQIWRCPMGASYQGRDREGANGNIHDILYDNPHLAFPQSNMGEPLQNASQLLSAVLLGDGAEIGQLSEALAVQLVPDRADIDISGPEFNFVRSIRVFDVRTARQQAVSRDSECSRNAIVVLGTYGTQGDFSWRPSVPGELPDAHVGLERWGYHCPSIFHRSVFVDWRDYNGNYGFEQVNY